jgi:hypothetical protein
MRAGRFPVAGILAENSFGSVRDKEIHIKLYATAAMAFGKFPVSRRQGIGEPPTGKVLAAAGSFRNLARICHGLARWAKAAEAPSFPGGKRWAARDDGGNNTLIGRTGIERKATLMFSALLSSGMFALTFCLQAMLQDVAGLR